MSQNSYPGVQRDVSTQFRRAVVTDTSSHSRSPNPGSRANFISSNPLVVSASRWTHLPIQAGGPVPQPPPLTRLWSRRQGSGPRPSVGASWTVFSVSQAENPRGCSPGFVPLSSPSWPFMARGSHAWPRLLTD